MEYIISESQYHILVKEQLMRFSGPISPYVIKKGWESMDNHTQNTILGLAALTIPYIGRWVSAGIQLYDAKQYWDEGDKKTAGLMAMFAGIPAMGSIAAKLGLASWGAKALSEIGKKISFGSKFFPAEVEVVKKITQNRKLIEDGMKKLGQDATISAGKELAKTQLKKQAVGQSVKSLGKQAGVYGGAYVGYNKGYDYARRETPKVKASVEGLDWDFVKLAFGSSGNEQDNKLLNLAWDKGWRPGKIVPQEFQTKQYKTNYTKENEDFAKLEALIAQAEKK